MKRKKVIAAGLACALLVLGLFVLAGCSSSSTKSADGTSVVISLPVKADTDTWTHSESTAGIVTVSEPQKAGTDKVEFTVAAAKDGSTSVIFTNAKDGASSASTVTYDFEVKDGKIKETGHAEKTSGNF